MPTTSTAALLEAYEDNNIGAISAANLRDLVVATRAGGVIEVFDPKPETGFGIAYPGSGGTAWPTTIAPLDDFTEPPAYYWLRPRLLGSTEPGHRYFSQVDGAFSVSTDTYGYTYGPGETDPLGVVCDLEAAIYGESISNTMFGALVVYKTASGSSFGDDTSRHFVIPFDTGTAGTAPFPLFCADRTTIVIMPGETVRVRLEYYGTSGGAAITPVIGGVTVKQFRTAITVRSAFQPYSDASSTEPTPSSGTRMLDYSDMWGKSCGVPQANRSGLVP